MNRWLYGTTFLRSPDGGAAGTGTGSETPAAGAAPPAAGTGAPPAAGAASTGGEAGTGGQGGASLPARPDWIEEKFWDGEKGAPRVEDLAKSYQAIQAKMSTRNDDLRKQIAADLDKERLSRRPASADKYVAQPPKGLLPEGVEFKADQTNPLFKWWNGFAFEQGMSQEQYEHGIAAYIEALGHGLPDPEAEIKKLGDDGLERANRAGAWAKANLSEKGYKTVAQLASTAEGVELVEELVRMTMGRPQGAGPAGGGGGVPTLAELEAGLQDPRYRDPFKRDPAFVKRIDEGFAKLAATGGGRRS